MFQELFKEVFIFAAFLGTPTVGFGVLFWLWLFRTIAVCHAALVKTGWLNMCWSHPDGRVPSYHMEKISTELMSFMFTVTSSWTVIWSPCLIFCLFKSTLVLEAGVWGIVAELLQLSCQCWIPEDVYCSHNNTYILPTWDFFCVLTDVTGTGQLQWFRSVTSERCIETLFIAASLRLQQPLEKVLPHCQSQQSHFLSFPVGRKRTGANFRRGASRATMGEEKCICKWKSIYVSKPAVRMKQNLCEHFLMW